VVANARNITKANPFPERANLALVDGDIGYPKTAARIVETAVSRFGRIDVLINNAGIYGDSGRHSSSMRFYSILQKRDTHSFLLQPGKDGPSGTGRNI
jgi:NAD(P)-dependent dehydrogenase (short-subunit alcohol dehydrogenase family)